MGFDVKRIFRFSSDKNGGRSRNTDTDSPSEDDIPAEAHNLVYSRYNPGIPPNDTAGQRQSVSTWRSNTHEQGQKSRQPGVLNRAKDIRTKASHISGGYFNGLSSGGAAAGSSNSGIETRLDKLFDELRNAAEDPKDSMGVESTMNYLTSLGLNPESGEIFVALELVQAPNFGEITRKGFVDGWKDTGANPTTADHAKYIAKLVIQFSSDPAYFKRVYRYTFVAGKEADQRSMGLDNAIEFWRVLFTKPGRPWTSPQHNWIELWISFLREKWTRSVNRDMWNQTLEFATKSMEDDTLGFWSEDGAWPSVIDDFVSWCRIRGIGVKDAMQTDS